MCANVDLEATRNFVKKHKGQKQIRVYKYLSLDKEYDYDEDGVENNVTKIRLLAPYRCTEYKPGVIKSNSNAKLQTKHNAEISRGIHTFVNKKYAEEMNLLLHLLPI